MDKTMEQVTEEEVQELYKHLKRDAEKSGYHLNPDEEMTRDLVRGLITNEKRLGYPGCPCRLAAGDRKEDLDIICPCDYRDADLTEYGMCYCALYVSGDILSGRKAVSPISERRPSPEERARAKDAAVAAVEAGGRRAATVAAATPLSKPVWRCRVCGYLCGRDAPPEVCPICKAKQERFERFI